MPAIAIKLRNGMYRIGRKNRELLEACRYAERRGYRLMNIIDEVTGTMIDYVDVYMLH